jgi:hypothetical protein
LRKTVSLTLSEEWLSTRKKQQRSQKVLPDELPNETPTELPVEVVVDVVGVVASQPIRTGKEKACFAGSLRNRRRGRLRQKLPDF